MKFNKASMRAHHMRVGQNTLIDERVSSSVGGPDRRVAYATERYNPGHGSQSPFAALSVIANPIQKQPQSPHRPVGFLCRMWGFL